MNIGTLTGQIELDDLLSGVLMKVDAKLRAVEEAAGSSMSLTAGKMTLAVAAGNLLASALTNVAVSAVSFAKDIITNSVMAGAELERLAKVSVFLGERLGYSESFVNKLSTAIEKSGITGQEARNAIIQLENAHVNLAKASELSAAAQNMAVVSGRGSSETYGMMIRAITTLNPMMIRSAGFTFTMEKVLSDYERTTGKTTATMGMHEKQGLLVNAMLLEAADKQGLYNEALKTSAKQLTSADRAWTQVSEQIGTAILPITDALTESWYRLATSVRDSAMNSQGAVKGLITSVSEGVVSVIKSTTDISADLVDKGKAVYDLYQKLPPVFRDWGKAAAELALGLWAVNTAATALATSRGAVWLTRLGAGGASIAGAIPAAATAAFVGQIYFMKKAIDQSYDSWTKLIHAVENPKAAILGMLTDASKNPEPTTPTLENKAQPLKFNMQKYASLPDENKLESGRAAMAALSAFLEKQQQLQAEYTSAVTGTVDAVRKANNEQKANAEALEKTDVAMRSTKESLAMFLPMIEKQISLGRTLTETQRNLYTTAKDLERADIAAGSEKLKKLGVSIQEIDALRITGKSEAELALAYGVSTSALNARIAAMNVNKGLLTEITQLESQLNDSLATQAQKQRDLTFEERVSKLDPNAIDYEGQVKALDAIRQASFQLEMTNLETLKENQLSNLQTIATKETETYENMIRNRFNLITGQEEYSAAAIDAQRTIAEAAQQAAIEVYGYWTNALEGMKAITHDIVAEIRTEIASLGDGTFGAMDKNGNRSGLPWVPYSPGVSANASGAVSDVAQNVSVNPSSPNVTINANGAFFGANQRQVTRTIEDLLAKSSLEKGK